MSAAQPAHQGTYQGAPQGSVRMGRWILSSVPAGWWFVPDFGLQHNTASKPPSNVTVKDDTLLAGDQLAPYIEVQVNILKGSFPGATFAGPRPSTLIAADECLMLLIRHLPRDGVSILQVQTYVRLGTWLGIITLTSPEQMLPTVRKDYEQFAASLTIAPPDPEAGPEPGRATTEGGDS